jgi:hypothetical protein
MSSSRKSQPKIACVSSMEALGVSFAGAVDRGVLMSLGYVSRTLLTCLPDLRVDRACRLRERMFHHLSGKEKEDECPPSLIRNYF